MSLTKDKISESVFAYFMQKFFRVNSSEMNHARLPMVNCEEPSHIRIM